ncbi:MAG: hypothetical protein K8U57_02135 [Planctomycetes bacterium]|nr:hypothetical protein [Planctomycetota bacterium]
MIRFLSSLAAIAALANAASAAESPAPVTLPSEARPDGPRLSIGRSTECQTTVLAFSADGKTVAATTNGGFASGMDAPVHLWDTATGKHVRTLKWHKVGVMAAAFSNDGATIATSGIDNQLRFWDGKTGKDITKADLPLTGHGYALSFSPDGKRLLVGSTKLEMYDVETQKPLKAKGGFFADTERNQFFHTATWSPKGKYVVAGCDGAGVRIWEAESGMLVQSLPLHYVANRTRFAFSSDDKFLLISTWPKGLMQMFEVGKEKEVKTVDVPKGEVSPEQLQFAREMGRVSWIVQTQQYQQGSRTLVVADATGQELKRFEVPSGAASQLISPDGSRIAVGGTDGSLRFFEAENGKPVSVALGGWSPVYQTVYADGGKLLRVIHTDGLIHDFDADSGKTLREVKLDLKTTPHLIATSQDGKLLATASDAGECVLWDLGTGKEQAKPKGKLHGYREPGAGPPGPFPLPPGPQPVPPGVAPPPPPGGVRLPPPPFERQPGPLQLAATFSLNGKLFAAVVAEGDNVLVWDATNGEEKHAVKVPKGTGTLAFSADATHIFTAQNWPAQPEAVEPDGEKAGAGFIRRFELKSSKQVQDWRALGSPELKGLRYASSRVQSLFPLADGATLAVVEEQIFNYRPPPPFPPGGRAPVALRFKIRLIDLAGRMPDRVTEADSAAGVGVSEDGKQLGFLTGFQNPPITPKTLVRVVDTATGQVSETEVGEPRPFPGTAKVAFRPGGKELTVTSGDSLLAVWERSKLREKKPDGKKE